MGGFVSRRQVGYLAKLSVLASTEEEARAQIESDLLEIVTEYAAVKVIIAEIKRDAEPG